MRRSVERARTASNFDRQTAFCQQPPHGGDRAGRAIRSGRCRSVGDSTVPPGAVIGVRRQNPSDSHQKNRPHVRPGARRLALIGDEPSFEFV